MKEGSVQREPFDFGGVTSFEAVWEKFGEQDECTTYNSDPTKDQHISIRFRCA